MCGITGFIDYTKSINKNIITDMTEAIFSRGPDDGDSFFASHSDYNIALGHRRLSIIDLSAAGKQPMHHNHLSLVFNGEIYNYHEIKEKLKRLGHTFKTQSDSEVLLASYLEWGAKCLELFVGMFAFAIYDQNKQELFVARDRFGVKPLYYISNSQLFAFSSEIKGLTPLKVNGGLDNASATHYFQFGYTDSHNTIYRNIKKLLPGTYSKINLKKKEVSNHIYWSASSHIESNTNRVKEKSININQVLNDIESLITESCKYRLVSDVPVGVFLSGGYDSSLVASICNKLQPGLSTFTISFSEKEYDEGVHAEKIAKYLGTNHHNHLCDELEAIKFSKMLTNVYDEPFGDSSSIPTLLLSQFAKRHVKVCLSADGGDEIFAGYTRYAQLQKIINNKMALKLSSYLTPLGFLSKVLENKVYNFKQRAQKIHDIARSDTTQNSVNILASYFSVSEVSKLLNQSSFRQEELVSPELDTINQMLLHDTIKYLPNDILTKVDRASMHYGLEAREPLLDHKLYEYVAALPGRKKLNSNELKYILKSITHKYIPKEMLDRPKKGFSVPIKKWMSTIYREEFLDLLNDDTVKRQGFLNVNETRYFKETLISDENINYQKHWMIFQFQKWVEKSTLNLK
jgi:asparagine synthase (glutamine-hydrolysing)